MIAANNLKFEKNLYVFHKNKIDKLLYFVNINLIRLSKYIEWIVFMAPVKDTTWIKRNNKLIILDSLRSKALSRSDLVRITNLSAGTVSTLVTELVDDGIIYENSELIMTTGRPKKLLSINSNYDLFWIFYVDKSSVSLSIYNEKAELISDKIISHVKTVQNDLSSVILNEIYSQGTEVKPYFIYVCFGEEISPSERRMYHTDWGEGINLSVVEYLSTCLHTSIFIREINDFSYWVASPDISDNCLVLSIDHEIDLRVFVDKSQMTANREKLNNHLENLSNFLIFIENLCVIFNLDTVILYYSGENGKKTAFKISNWLFERELTNISICLRDGIFKSPLFELVRNNIKSLISQNTYFYNLKESL